MYTYFEIGDKIIKMCVPNEYCQFWGNLQELGAVPKNYGRLVALNCFTLHSELKFIFRCQQMATPKCFSFASLKFIGVTKRWRHQNTSRRPARKAEFTL